MNQAAPQSALHPIGQWLGDHPGFSRLLVIAALLLLWEVAARGFGDPLFVASPTQILAGLKPLLAIRGMPQALLVTGWELMLAFALSVIVGVMAGAWLGLSRFADRTFMPIVLLLYATPQVTVIPIFMLVFGIGPASKVAYGFSHGIFPIIVTVAASVRNINPALLVSSRAMGANGGQLLRHVVFPHMVPSLFTGMRLGMTATLLGVILAELYASLSGVGYFSKQFAQAFQPASLFGLILIVAVMAILINELLRLAETKLTVWRRSGR